MKQILHTIRRGGSGFGLSFYGQWANGCPRKATLDTLSAEDFGVTSMDSKYTGIGKVIHAFMELHYARGKKGVFDTTVVKFSQGVDEEDRAEGERVFRHYRARFPPDELGKVLYIEKRFPEDGNEEQKKVLEEAVGISPFGITPDLVVKIDARAAKRLWLTRRLDVVPGVYLVDHKSAAQWDGCAMDRFLSSHQFCSYQLGWNAIFPKLKARGVICNVLLRYKEPEIRTFIVPPPSQATIKSLHAYLRYSLYIKEHIGDWPNPSPYNCFPKGNKPCHWYTTGDCQRF